VRKTQIDVKENGIPIPELVNQKERDGINDCFNDERIHKEGIGDTHREPTGAYKIVYQADNELGFPVTPSKIEAVLKSHTGPQSSIIMPAPGCQSALFSLSCKVLWQIYDTDIFIL
jgi:hypothetical protein